MKIKPATAWAMRSDKGDILPFTVARLRVEAIRKWLAVWDRAAPEGCWHHWHQRGWRPIRVNITAVR